MTKARDVTDLSDTLLKCRMMGHAWSRPRLRISGDREGGGVCPPPERRAGAR